MINNFDYFSSRLAWARQCGNRPNWTVLAHYFLTYHGIADDEGNPLHREKVRLTWLRVQSARKRLGKPAVLSPTPPPTTAVSGVQVTTEPTRSSNTGNDALADMLAEMNKRSGRT